MRTISLRQFRDSIADQAEPVIVQRRDKAGNFQIIGSWRPMSGGVPAAQLGGGGGGSGVYIPDIDRGTTPQVPVLYDRGMSERYPHLADMIRGHRDSDPEYSMSQWIEEEGIPDVELLAMADDAELGAAWADAEAARPDATWDLSLENSGAHRRAGVYRATCQRRIGEWHWEAEDPDPAAALRALVAQLRERPDADPAIGHAGTADPEAR